MDSDAYADSPHPPPPLYAPGRRRRWLLAIWIVGLLLVFIAGFIAPGGSTVRIGSIVNQAVGLQILTIPISIYQGGKEAKLYEARIFYSSGRKGPHASLEIYQVIKTDGVEEEKTRVALSIDPDVVIPGRADIWPAEKYPPTVAEAEVFSPPAYLYPLDINHDYVPDFFLYQGADVNRRALPMPPGTYLVDYDGTADQWRLHRMKGFAAFMRVPANVEGLQTFIFTVMISLTLLTKTKGTKESLKVAAVMILAVGAFWIMTFGSIRYAFMGYNVLAILLLLAEWIRKPATMPMQETPQKNSA